MNMREITNSFAVVLVFSHHHPFCCAQTLLSPHSSLPNSCSPRCVLTPASCICSSASQAQAGTFQLPLATCKTSVLTLMYILQSVHTHQTLHLHIASLRITSWRQDKTQRVPVVLAFEVSESF